MSAVSAFKTLFTQMIENGGDYDSLPKDILKKDFQVFVKETRPYFLVSDSFFYVPAYFTQAALNDYNSKFPQVNVLDLEHRVIVITKWTLELRKVNSAEVFTSYAGVECRLIVHAFKPQLKEQLHPTRYPTNLYRDDEFKTTIQALRHRQVTEAAAAKSTSMAPLAGGKGQVSQGIVANSVGEWTFKEGNTKTVSLGAGKKKTDTAKAAKVKGGSKTKTVKKAKAVKGASVVDSVMKVTKTPTGKASRAGKKSLSKTKATPDESGKRTKPASSGVMTVAQYRKFLSTLKKGDKKGGKK